MIILLKLPAMRPVFVVLSAWLLVTLSCNRQDSSRESQLANNSTQRLSKITAIPLESLISEGQQLLYEGDIARATLLLEEALKRDSTIIDLHHLLADAYFEGMQSQRALDLLQNAAHQFKDSLRVHLKLAEIQLILKKYRASLQTIEHIHKLDPNNPDGFFLKGLVYKEMGDTSLALRQFQYTTRENPQFLDAWIEAGQLAMASGVAKASHYFEAGLRISPDHIPLLNALARYQALEGKYPQAKKLYRKIISIDPDYSKAYFDLGLLFLDQDSIELAEDHFNLAVETDPVFATAYFYRGLARELKFDTVSAIHDYRQALSLDPSEQRAEKGVNRLIGIAN